MKKIPVRIIGSAAVSALVLCLLYAAVSHSGGELSVARIIHCIKNAVWPLVAVYALCHVFQTFIRAARARMLLRAGMPEHDGDQVPGLWRVSLVMFVRGACVDMLPMRVGELSYVAMLSGGYKISVANCLSSLSIGLLFDFAALLIVLVAAITALSQGLSLVGAAVVLVIVCVAGWFGLFKILPWFAALLQKRSPDRIMSIRWYAWCVKTLSETAGAVAFVGLSGKVAQVMLLSAAIRLLKYLGLYILFLGITSQTWPDLAGAGVPSVLTALISAEGAAALPVPTFMSFGSYEAGGILALTALGFSAADSMAAMLSTHLLSQMLDYGLGGLAFLVFLWSPRLAQPDIPEAGRKRRAARMSAGVAAGLAAFAVAVGMLFSFFDSPETAESSEGIGVPVEGAENAQRALRIAGVEGRIAWSSNREGTHSIYMIELPSGKKTRLTNAKFTDTYPRFSPDGKRVAFSRSHLPYVSQRDQLKWDTWVVDLAAGEETLVATNAFTAVWDADGESLVYVRDGGKLVKQKAVAGAMEEMLLEAGRGAVPYGNEFQTPNVGYNGRGLAFTLRGSANGTYISVDGATPLRIDGGCEITWQGRDSSTMLWVNHPGKQRNTIFKRDGIKAETETLLDVEADHSHEYFPKTSADGVWMVYGASTGGHEHDQADYEIFLWKIGAPQNEIKRVTWHTGNDCWPDIFVDE